MKALLAYTPVSKNGKHAFFIFPSTTLPHLYRMSSIKQVIEILASSDKSFEDALQRAVASLSTSVPNISGIYIKDQSCKVRDNRIVEYRITARVSFGTPVEDFDTSELERTYNEAPVAGGNGAPDYSTVDFHAQPTLDVEPGGSATEPASGGGYSG